MRLLITGSSGQIGTNLAVRCLADGHEVVGIDRRGNAWTDRFKTIVADLAVSQPVREWSLGDVALPPCDVIVHLAAHAKVHALVERPLGALENHIMVTNALELARSTNTPIVLASSREVYGQQPQDGGPVDEAAAAFGISPSPYAAAKLASEALGAAYERCYGLPYLVFRFSNVYGRYDNDLHRLERVLWIFARAIERGEPITVYGGGKLLDFTYVDDAVDGLWRGIQLLVDGAISGETFNLAYGEGSRLTTLARYLGTVLEQEPHMLIESARPGEVTYYVADIARARQQLGYEPKVSLREGVHRALVWAQGWEETHPRPE
ncbi:MAG: nucleoside-diphosphate sugar epimerase [Dehalococcoidia bacterium]|nr:nucleoside-diphosphate sugar epimerase [Dehalococcoidia bacterium]